MKSRPKYPQPLPPDLHPGAEPQPSTGVPAPHPGFNSLSEWFTLQPCALPTGISEEEVTELWRDADRANAAAINKIEQEDARTSALVAALSKLGTLAERIRAESGRFSRMSRLELLEIDDE
tara:strand:- start:763 stop:1125 length:363 start_codon:yes stop_codon:yes gene_type:complete